MAISLSDGEVSPTYLNTRPPAHCFFTPTWETYRTTEPSNTTGRRLHQSHLQLLHHHERATVRRLATLRESCPGGLASLSGGILLTCHQNRWNGATDVASWQFWSGPTPTGPFTLMATVPWAGFETSYLSPGFVGFVYAVALDANGNAMGNTPTVTTAVGNTGCS